MATDPTAPQAPMPHSGRPLGTQAQASQAATAQNPRATVPATTEEQAQYAQFVTRFLMFISDSHNGPKSPAAATMRMLNNSHKSVAQAIGDTTASVAFVLVKAAEAQKIHYPIDVLMHACFECVAAVYVLGAASGIFRGIPKFQGLNRDGSYSFSRPEIKILVHAQFAAVQAFGNMEVKAGMLSPQVRQQNEQFWKEQIQYEVAHHLVDDSVLQKIAKTGAFNKLEQQATQRASGAQPQQPQQPQAAPPQAPQSPQGQQAPNPMQMAQESDQSMVAAGAQPNNVSQLPP